MEVAQALALCITKKVVHQRPALVAEGKPYGVIAEHPHVSYKTVANLHPAQGRARRTHPAGADADCHSASPLGDVAAAEIDVPREIRRPRIELKLIH
jgi:hypothetical protein